MTPLQNPEVSRESRPIDDRLPVLDSLWQNLRFAARMLRKSPGFTAIAVAILALAIGANTAIFSVANLLLLEPLPFSDPSRLVVVANTLANDRSQTRIFSYQRSQQLHASARSFSGFAAFTNETFNLTGFGDPEQINSARVDANFFEVLRIHMTLGRGFLPEEDLPGGPNVAVISQQFWREKFGGDTNIIGRGLDLDSRRYTIVGVLPPRFVFALLGGNVGIWAPRVFELNAATPAQIQGGAGYLSGIARLKPGVTVAQAQSELDVLTSEFRKERPGWPDSSTNLVLQVNDLQQQTVGNFRSALLMLFGAVGLLLLIACANVAGLFLSRSLARRKEIAVRTALGAARGAIVRQLLTESVLLAAVAGALGVVVGVFALRFLTAFVNSSVPILGGIHLDSRVLAFTAFISLLSGVLFGLIPSLQISNVDLNRTLREEGRGTSGGRRVGSLRNIFAVAQIALSLVLLIACGLLIRSFVRLVFENPGVNPENVVTLQLNLAPTRYPDAAHMIPFYNSLVDRVAALPGIRDVALCSALPANATRFSPILAEDQPQVPISQRPVVAIETDTPDFMRVLGIPLIQGREFSPHDDVNSAPVVLINQVLARAFFANTNPVGKHITLGRRPVPSQIVGVVGDVKNISLASPAGPEIFIPYAQLPWSYVNIVARTQGDPHHFISAIRSQVTALDPGQSITNPLTLDELLQAARVQQRFLLTLLSVFAGTAFLLAAIGIYGVVAYSVSQRTQEIGLRMALGAEPSAILRLVLGNGLILAVSGVLIGAAIAIAANRLLSSQLYEVTTYDPLTFLASSALFIAVATVASAVPARRAMQVDPLVALRHE